MNNKLNKIGIIDCNIGNIYSVENALKKLKCNYEISKEIEDELNDIRSNNPTPLIYSIPGPGSNIEQVNYRDLIKKVLKMS